MPGQTRIFGRTTTIAIWQTCLLFRVRLPKPSPTNSKPKSLQAKRRRLRRCPRLMSRRSSSTSVPKLFGLMLPIHSTPRITSPKLRNCSTKLLRATRVFYSHGACSPECRPLSIGPEWTIPRRVLIWPTRPCKPHCGSSPMRAKPTWRWPFIITTASATTDVRATNWSSRDRHYPMMPKYSSTKVSSIAGKGIGKKRPAIWNAPLS